MIRENIDDVVSSSIKFSTVQSAAEYLRESYKKSNRIYAIFQTPQSTKTELIVCESKYWEVLGRNGFTKVDYD